MLDHLGLGVSDLARSRAFYERALEPLGISVVAGGTDNGPPGIREIYHPNYYGAFIHDPDGHNIEAVKHAPE